MKNRFSIVLLVLLILCITGGAVVLFLLNEREAPAISLATDLAAIGASREIPFTVADQRSGVRSWQARLEQGGKSMELGAAEFPRQGYFGRAGAHLVNGAVAVDVKKTGVQEGEAVLVIEARDFSFWNFLNGNVAVLRKPVLVDTEKPKIALMDFPRYVDPGGSSIVVYRTNEPLVRHGAVINGLFHQGVELGGDGGRCAAMLGIPYDTEKIDEMFIVAVDRAGNESKVPFSMLLHKARWQRDKIAVSDGFLGSKIPEFSSNIKELPEGSDLDKYLFINREVRKADNETIRRVCSVVTPEKLWDGAAFDQLPRSGRKAGFADHRTYMYDGKDIDMQVHLGVDLASTQHAPVPAANRGRVVYAEYLGIYGNMVILDHGWGLFSLYSHLNEIEVKVGDLVERGGVLGKTGMTGMAGGDHLHFSVLVNGVFVSPLEWWDPHWIGVNILPFI
ncbi:MAG: M23 family metallopeptidase [Thermodesulfobacteriota bacterium]